MKHLVLLSILIALVAIPIRLAGARSPRRALIAMAVAITSFTISYMVVLRFIYPRIL